MFNCVLQVNGFLFFSEDMETRNSSFSTNLKNVTQFGMFYPGRSIRIFNEFSSSIENNPRY